METLSAPPTASCTCSVCRNVARDEYRVWMSEKREDFERLEDLEAMTTKGWHDYAPLRAQLRDALPERATSVAESYLLYPDRPLKQTAALVGLRAWQRAQNVDEDDAKTFAVVAGPPGTGKTVAAVWLLLHRLADQDPVFLSSHELVRVLDERRGRQRERLLETGMLVIDDLGAEHAGPAFIAAFDELVDARYASTWGPVIITTNCTPPQFEARYGTRVADRIDEIGRWIAATGKSMRGARGAGGSRG